MTTDTSGFVKFYRPDPNGQTEYLGGVPVDDPQGKTAVVKVREAAGYDCIDLQSGDIASASCSDRKLRTFRKAGRAWK